MPEDKLYCFEVVHCSKDPQECPMIGAVKNKGAWFATFHNFEDLSLKCRTQDIYLLGPMASIHEITSTDVKVAGKFLLLNKDDFMQDIEKEHKKSNGSD